MRCPHWNVALRRAGRRVTVGLTGRTLPPPAVPGSLPRRSLTIMARRQQAQRYSHTVVTDPPPATGKPPSSVVPHLGQTGVTPGVSTIQLSCRCCSGVSDASFARSTGVIFSPNATVDPRTAAAAPAGAARCRPTLRRARSGPLLCSRSGKGPSHVPPYSIASSSTSKISVAFGGIVGGDPRGP